MAKGGLDQYYASIPELPAHIKDRLLTFNILQLCALVSEKPGAKWSGASDHYGPINEIARRWKLDDLAKRIEHMRAEEPLRTYARIMQVLPGGNPETRRVKEFEKKLDDIEQEAKKERARFGHRSLPDDEVVKIMAGCTTVDDLRRIAKEHDIASMTEDRWEKMESFKNFGLKRMYVGNAWRALLRQRARRAHNLDENTSGML